MTLPDRSVLPWRTRPIAMIDIETTGLDLYADSVVEMACVVLEGNKITRKFSTRVNPGVPIPAEATAIHGVSDAMVAKAPKFAEAAIELANCIGTEADLVVPAAFNAGFDKPFLAIEYVRHFGVVPWFCRSEVGWLDPYVYGRRAFKYEKGKKQLSDIARHCNVKADDAHTALGDCMTALRCLFRLAERRKDGELMIPEALGAAIERQDMFQADEAASMLEYMAKMRQDKAAKEVTA
jgi:DNA polymerase III subunit epsilon